MDDLHLALNPLTPPGELQRMAADQPTLRPLIALHPAAYPALLEWLGTLGDPEIEAALAKRLGASGGPTAQPQSAPPVAPAPPIRLESAPTLTPPSLPPSSADVPPQQAMEPPAPTVSAVPRRRWWIPVVATVGALAVVGGAAAVVLPRVLGDDEPDEASAQQEVSSSPSASAEPTGSEATPDASPTEAPEPTDTPEPEPPAPVAATFADGAHLAWEITAADLVPARPEIGEAYFTWMDGFGGQAPTLAYQPLLIGDVFVMTIGYGTGADWEAPTQELVGASSLTGEQLWHREVPSAITCEPAGAQLACLENGSLRLIDPRSGEVRSESPIALNGGTLWAGKGGGLLITTYSDDWTTGQFEVFSDDGEQRGTGTFTLPDSEIGLGLEHDRVIVYGVPTRVYDLAGQLLLEAEGSVTVLPNGSLWVVGEEPFVDTGLVQVIATTSSGWIQSVETSTGPAYFETAEGEIALGDDWRVSFDSDYYPSISGGRSVTVNGEEAVAVLWSGSDLDTVVVYGLDGTQLSEFTVPFASNGQGLGEVYLYQETLLDYSPGALRARSFALGSEIWSLLPPSGMSPVLLDDAVVLLAGYPDDDTSLFRRLAGVLPGVA